PIAPDTGTGGTIMYEVTVRIRCLLRQGVVEFTRDIALRFKPCRGLVLHEGPDPNTSVSHIVAEVRWFPGVEPGLGRFQAQLVDDLEAAATFGDDYDSLRRAYEARGWQLLRAGSLRLLGWPFCAGAVLADNDRDKVA